VRESQRGLSKFFNYRLGADGRPKPIVVQPLLGLPMPLEAANQEIHKEVSMGSFNSGLVQWMVVEGNYVLGSCFLNN